MHLAAFVVFALSVELDEEETSKGPPLLVVGFFEANTKNDTAKESRVLLPMVEMRDKKSGVPFDESPLPFCLPFPQITFFAPLTKLFWAAQNVP